MNKKLLFGLMSLAALAACTNDDFDSQQVAEGTSPIQFEVINNNASMRASMDKETGNKVVWSAADGDLFTLYHGGSITGNPAPLTGYENATYTASKGEGVAVLTTPSMIKAGKAIMTWPADTVFRATGGNLTIVIPKNQTKDIQYEIPYVSDVIDIANYAAYSETAPTTPMPTAYNTAGKDRKYAVYMRPMASQLNLKADYAGTDETIAQLYEGATGVATGEGIEPIKVTSVELLTTPTASTTPFTTEIPLSFTAATPADGTRWDAKVDNNAWSHVTGFGTPAGPEVKLTTSYCPDNESSKFLILPQATLTTGVADAGVVVNTIYGKVVIADPALPNVHGTKYTATEYANAWYRYLPSDQKITTATTEENVSAATPSDNGLYKTVAKGVAYGMQQTINYMSTYVAKASVPVVGTEPIGVALTRYVNVNLEHLDMSDLHIKNDQQLRNAAKVWKHMGLTGVTVYLDGDATTGEFEISQATIAKINEVNTGKTFANQFHVKPCHIAAPTSEVCTRIVIKDGGNVPNLDFIVAGNTPNYADVVLKAGKNWSWTTNNVTIATDTKKAIKVGTGVQSIINEGTFASGAATIATCNAAATAWTNTPFVNAKGAEWNVTAGDLTVQFNVTNYGTVKIASGAEYHQDIALGAATTFTNEAEDLPLRFGGDDAEIGKVENKGVFAVTGTTTTKGIINNYGLIEHAANAAKTYITTNELTGTTFATPFSATGTKRKIGRINLPYSNKDEDNISVSSALNSGFVSVTVTSGDAPATKKLNLTAVGDKVNYVIIKGGIDTVTEMTAAIKYIEFDANGTEIAWQAGTSTAPVTATYEGLIVLSPVNIKLYTNVVVNQATYLGAKMYVGGTFTNGTAGWAGYYGDTAPNESSMYITY